MTKNFTLGVAASALAAVALPALAGTPGSLPLYGAMPATESYISEAVAKLAPAKAMTLPTTTPLTVDFTTWDTESFNNNFIIENGNDDEACWKFWNTWPVIGEQFGNGVAGVITSELDSKPANNEWMITKTPVRLEAGKEYRFKTEVGTYGTSYNETFEVKLGTTASSADMSIPLLTSTTFFTEKCGDRKDFTRDITVETTGDYYIGFHSTSTWRSGYFMFVFNFALTSNEEVTAPVAPAAPTVEPDANGTLSAKISVVAPAMSITDNPLPDLTAVDLYRDNNKVYTWSAPTPGATLTWTDTQGITMGNHEWYAVATNTAGTSAASEKTAAFVGINIPSAPTNAKATRTSKPGEITVSWDAPALDKDGFAVIPGSLKYRIVEVTDDGLKDVADNVAATSYTYQAVAADAEQQLKQYFIYSKTTAGECAAPVATNAAPVGKALALPYLDSFANGKSAYSYQIENTGTGKWGFYNSYYVAQDGDKGVAAFTGSVTPDASTLTTYNIDIPADMVNPIASFYYSGRTEGNNNKLAVLIDAGEGLVQLAECKEMNDGTWHRVIVKLDEYKGKTIRLAFKGEYTNNECILLDVLSIGARAKKNVAITGYSIPKTMKVANDNEIKATITNIGSEAATGIKVNLLRNNEVIDTKTIDNLAAEASTTVDFVENPPVYVKETNAYRIEVAFTGDEEMSDNTIQDVTTRMEYPSMPKVTDLAVAIEGTKAVLTWSKPNFEGGVADYMTEDFEGADAWAKDTAAGWTLLDRDNTPNVSESKTGNNSTQAEGVKFPGVSGEVTSFFVLDDTDLRDVYKAHSGHKSLCSETTYQEDGNKYKAKKDDWMISPELSGAEQTVSFFVRSTNQNKKEQFEILASTTNSTDPADFTMVSNYASVPALWMKIEINLPAGTRRFAIRCTSDDCAEFMVDDVTFMPTYEAQGIDIVGYNIYCNNEKITAEPITETTFSEELAKDDVKRYAVTCVYNKGGESALSNVVLASISGIEDIENAAGAAIATMPGMIDVTTQAAMPVSIYTLDGRVIFSGMCTGRTTVEAATGIYIVKAGRQTAKVAVR